MTHLPQRRSGHLRRPGEGSNAPLPSTRDGAPIRAAFAGFFSSGNATERHDRSDTMDPMPNSIESTEASMAWNRAIEPRRRSRAAEFVAALYVALVLCTPWLVRDSLTLTPPSSGIEMQFLSQALPPAASDTTAQADAASSR
jgi:hypothetical protein